MPAAGWTSPKNIIEHTAWQACPAKVKAQLQAAAARVQKTVHMLSQACQVSLELPAEQLNPLAALNRHLADCAALLV